MACVKRILKGLMDSSKNEENEKVKENKEKNGSNKTRNRKRNHDEENKENDNKNKKRKGGERGIQSQVLDQEKEGTKEKGGHHRIQTFVLQKDCAGHSRSSDIVIFETSKNMKKEITKEIHISVKSNNMSIKHPSVSNMPKQLQMDSVAGAKFKSELTSIYDHFYNQWSKDNQTLNTVTRLEKTKLYKRVNNLRKILKNSSLFYWILKHIY